MHKSLKVGSGSDGGDVADEVDPDGRMPSRRSAILFLKRWELRSWSWGKGCVHFEPMSCKAHSTRGVIGCLDRHLGPGK